jgi:hypothetical protein
MNIWQQFVRQGRRGYSAGARLAAMACESLFFPLGIPDSFCRMREPLCVLPAVVDGESKFLWLFGGATGSRTPDLLIANETLYQLSYDPNQLL